MTREDGKYFIIFCLGFLFFACFGKISLADEVILENGDRLTGTVIKVEEGTLTLATEYSDPVKIHKDKIRTISTDQPIEIHLTGGEILKGSIKSEEGRMTVESSTDRERTFIDWGKVSAVNPEPVPPSQWHGNITLGGNLQSGNTKRSSASVGADAVRRTAQDRFSLRFLFNYAKEQEITARNTYGALKYDYFFTKVFYGYLAVELLNDKFKDLNLRTVVGPGVGYQVWEDPVKFLLLEAGVSYFSEDRKEAEDDHWITARLAGDFRYNIGGRVIFSDQLIIYPNLEQFGRYQLRNEAALTTPLASGWSLRFANILERDSNPAAGVKKNDIYWILGLQYAF